MAKHTYEVEVTDTFAGEANYCWVRRELFQAPEGASRRAIVRRAKAAAGLSNVRCETHDYGDLIELRPRGACIVAFVTMIDEEGPAPDDESADDECGPYAIEREQLRSALQ